MRRLGKWKVCMACTLCFVHREGLPQLCLSGSDSRCPITYWGLSLDVQWSSQIQHGQTQLRILPSLPGSPPVFTFHPLFNLPPLSLSHHVQSVLPAWLANKPPLSDLHYDDRSFTALFPFWFYVVCIWISNFTFPKWWKLNFFKKPTKTETCTVI